LHTFAAYELIFYASFLFFESIPLMKWDQSVSSLLTQLLQPVPFKRFSSLLELDSLGYLLTRFLIFYKNFWPHNRFDLFFGIRVDHVPDLSVR